MRRIWPKNPNELIATSNYSRREPFIFRFIKGDNTDIKNFNEIYYANQLGKLNLFDSLFNLIISNAKYSDYEKLFKKDSRFVEVKKKDREEYFKTVMYAKRQYTDLNYNLLTIKYPVLALLFEVNHQKADSISEFRIKLGDSKKEYNYKFDTDERNAAIDLALDNIITYFSKQEAYCPDDCDRYHQALTKILTLFIEYYVDQNRVDGLNKIFEFLHVVGNKKAKNFKEVMTEDDTCDFIERPFYLGSEVIDSRLIMYYVLFYKTYRKGLFYKKILNDGAMSRFVYMSVRLNEYEPLYSPKFRKFFDTNKPKGCVCYSTFDISYKLNLEKIDADTKLDYLEQNNNLLAANIITKDFDPRSYRCEYYNNPCFNEIMSIGCLSKEENPIRDRFFKIITEYFNNNNLKPSEINNAINHIVKLWNTQIEANTPWSERSKIVAKTSRDFAEMVLDTANEKVKACLVKCILE